eukprot:scaffold3978_cov291-Pinguiococcus_pyrenoidosus.AAC.12
MTQALLLALLAALGGSSTALPLSRVQIRRSQLTPVLFAQQNNDERQVFTQKQRLREETEAPFRTARFFLYGGVGVRPGPSSVRRLCNGQLNLGWDGSSRPPLASEPSSTVKQPFSRPADLLPEYLQNLGVNAAGVGAAVVAWYFDSRAQQQRLARLAKGQRLSALKVRGFQDLDELDTVELRSLTADWILRCKWRSTGAEWYWLWPTCAAEGAQSTEEL